MSTKPIMESLIYAITGLLSSSGSYGLVGKPVVKYHQKVMFEKSLNKLTEEDWKNINDEWEEMNV